MPDRVRMPLSAELDGSQALMLAHQATAEGDLRLADRYFLRALRVSIDFDKPTARARYLEYLLDTGRFERAVSLAEGWVREGPRLNLNGFLTRLIAQDRDNLKRHLRRLQVERNVHPWSLMILSQELSQAGRGTAAIVILKRLIRWCSINGDKDDAWRAMGQLGRVYEDEGMDEHAEAVWSDAFHAGSSNRVLARRYTHYLERKRRFEECLWIVTEAMTRIRDQEVLALLDRRRNRLLRKVAAVGHASH